MKTVRIGTRNSALALWQAHYVGALLEKEGLTYEIVAISTKGDQILDRSLSKIGSKGVFTEELETMLRAGEIDIAQHSAKDLPSHLPAELELIAFTERESAEDVVLSLDPSKNLASNESLRIGTSSTRRRAFLSHFYPQHTAVEMRGNLQTRLEKLKNGDCDAMLLAFAGVHRMEMESYITQHLDIDQFVPAVGQGSVAIQCAVSLNKDVKSLVRKACNHPDTEARLLTERHLLAHLEGGCSVPVYGHAVLKGNKIALHAGVLSLDGVENIYHSALGSDPAILGKEVAMELIHLGAHQLLRKIRQQLGS
ncbi:MAG: hydroxymethylbilane synthase [Cytophagales bacterium]|nr:hydroxymethylbilane synthase [Cytophagales bacterium]